jgi:hypothetical protein
VGNDKRFSGGIKVSNILAPPPMTACGGHGGRGKKKWRSALPRLKPPIRGTGLLHNTVQASPFIGQPQ